MEIYIGNSIIIWFYAWYSLYKLSIYHLRHYCLSIWNRMHIYFPKYKSIYVTLVHFPLDCLSIWKKMHILFDINNHENTILILSLQIIYSKFGFKCHNLFIFLNIVHCRHYLYTIFALVPRIRERSCAKNMREIHQIHNCSWGSG